MEHSPGLTRHDRRTRVDPDDLHAVRGVEDERSAVPGCGVARPHDRQLRHDAPNADFRAKGRPRDVATVDDRELRLLVRWMAADGGSGSRRDLACPDIGNSVDLRQAVPAIPGEAEAPAVTRHLTATDDRDRDAVAGLERNRPAVDHEAGVGHAAAPVRRSRTT